MIRSYCVKINNCYLKNKRLKRELKNIVGCNVLKHPCNAWDHIGIVLRCFKWRKVSFAYFLNKRCYFCELNVVFSLLNTNSFLLGHIYDTQPVLQRQEDACNTHQCFVNLSFTYTLYTPISNVYIFTLRNVAFISCFSIC